MVAITFLVPNANIAGPLYEVGIIAEDLVWADSNKITLQDSEEIETLLVIQLTVSLADIVQL